MKKKTVRLLLLPLTAAMGLALSACGTQAVSTTTETPTTTPTETAVETTTAETTTATEVVTTTEIVKKDDYNDITATCKMTSDYEGLTFIEDGIEEATLTAATDGDTASFTTLSGESVTIRFYCINTPESTGQVEKWGKAASKFTKAKLEGAYAILLEASTHLNAPAAAEHDSYGTRYLGYVWYKETADSDWMNLNLELVENGYSPNKCLETSAYKYFRYFEKAEDFARNVPLHLWSDDDDPYYSTDAEEVTLKDLSDNPDAYWNSDEQVGSKVRFTGYVTDVYLSQTETYTYTVSENVDGTIYDFNVYAGYNSSGIPSFMKIGNRMTITGTLQNYYGKWQISGMTYVPMKKGGDYLTCLQKDYYITFDSSVDENDVSLYYNSSNHERYNSTLYDSPVVKTADITNGVLTITADATDPNDETVTTFTFNCPAPSSVDPSTLVGKTFSVSGIQEETLSCVITVSNYTDFSFK